MTIRNLAIAAACAATACSTNQRNSALVIERVVLATASTATTAAADAGTDAGTPDTCPSPTFEATADEALEPLFNPTDGTNGHGAVAFVVSNHLVNPSALNPTFRTDTTTFTPRQAVVDYEIVGGGASIPQQVVPASGTVISGSTGSPVLVRLFDSQAALTAMETLGVGVVRTTTRIEGTLDDGSKVSTSAHEYLVQVCSTATSPSCPASSTCF
jgi:hypothetical protein